MHAEYRVYLQQHAVQELPTTKTKILFTNHFLYAHCGSYSVYSNK